MRYLSDLDAKLLQLTPGDIFSIRDACQGVAVFGAIGSGKTSGSGAHLAGAYLRAGMGGCVLVAKPEEADLWRHYAKLHGRSESLIEFAPGTASFNFIAYELVRHGFSGINSVVECLMRVIEAVRMASPSPGRSGEAFWEDTMRQILRNTVPALYAAYGNVTVPDIIKFVRTAPRSRQEMVDREWMSESFFCHTLIRAQDRLDNSIAQNMVDYWKDEYATLDGKVRSSIVLTLTTTLDRFNHGWLRDAMTGSSTIVPELCFHGAILLLNMPALTLNEDGIIAQQVFKYMWQRSVLTRNALPTAQRERPVFLWADEAQYFINSYDAEYLSTCRGSRACTVFLSQSLPTYIAKVGGDHARDRVMHLLGNFATKIFHSNGCSQTNSWAAETIGKTIQYRASFSQNRGSSHGWSEGDSMGLNENVSRNGYEPTRDWWRPDQDWSRSEGYNDGRNRGKTGGTSSGSGETYSEQREYLIEPGEFGSILRTGGPANQNTVSAVWYQSGRNFAASGKNCLFTSFQQ